MATAVESLQLLLLVTAIRCGSSLHQGTPVQQENFGYVLQIYDPKFLAAGTLFSARYVLTVAHCFKKNTKPEQLTVRAGNDRIAREYKGKPVSGFMRHPKFSPLTLRNDIAVLRVKVALAYSRKISYIPLCSTPLRRDNDAPAPVIAGWSMMNITQPLKSIKVKVDVEKNCRQWFPQLPGGVSCASTSNSESLCYGDSGDPLISGGEVCGLAIGFRRCGDKRYPALFTEVHYHRSFISQAVLTLDKEMLKKPRGRG
ncbi:seminase [Drosophila rhopaloa]|uniref:Trypsin alpha-3 n=1 Tax=Drosophila rhopaloa TaxID=1041015 RepID=A0A6P4FMI3_DRORH|nr:seminase [Drosophila rhopaloa]